MESCSPDDAPRHAALIASMTGGMTPSPPAFAGSERFHPDGRPKGNFRESLRRIPDGHNALTVAAQLSGESSIIFWEVINAGMV